MSALLVSQFFSHSVTKKIVLSVSFSKACASLATVFVVSYVKERSPEQRDPEKQSVSVCVWQTYTSTGTRNVQLKLSNLASLFQLKRRFLKMSTKLQKTSKMAMFAELETFKRPVQALLVLTESNSTQDYPV